MELYFREKSVIIRSVRLLDELSVFIWHNHKAEAQRGYNDDLVMAFAIGMWVRDNALRIRNYGQDLNKQILNVMSNKGMSNTGVYNKQSQANIPAQYQQYHMNVKNERESLDWLLDK